ncbi:MAG: hypothetical protein LJE85_13150 [Gammaproteobacteria bacterium]|nr:hypothetical protein [Gammaproteobacteria bacterium]
MRKRSAPVLRPQNYRPQAHPQSHPQSMAAGEITFPKTGIVHFFKSRYKSVMAFAGSLWIFATLAVNYYNGLSLPFRATESGPNSAIVQQAPLTKTQSRPVTQKDIQPLAQALMEKPIWEAHDINEFTTQWIMLSAHKKDTLKNTKWFDPFVESFKKQIKFELARQHDGDGSIEIENRHRALLQLAVSLGMVRQPPRNLAALDELIAPQAPVRGKNSRNGSAKQAPKTAKAPTSAANVKSKATTASKKPSVKSANSKTKAAATTISGREITEVIDQYVSAFEKGSSQQMLGLFAEDNQLKRPLTLKSLRTQYSGLFDHSDERWVEFRELSWNKSSRETRGKGKLRTSVRVLPSGEYKTVTTNVMIAMRKIDNVTRITDFEISDDSIFAVASLGKAHKPTGGFAAKDRPKYPTQGELQDVITQYVDSYQSGDIRGIMELFASSTWTANPSGLEELRRDYLDLFDTTTDRQVFISNIDWTFKDNKAMGTGDLVINLLSNQDHKITKKKGKVRLIVEKNLQKARISHLFQIVN